MIVNKQLIAFFCLVYIFGVGFARVTNAQTNPTFNTVVIDPGHGGKDPGAVGRIAKEKDIVLGVALKLGNYIEKYLPDVKVVYTRKKDVFVPLDERAKLANEHEADLFISIHANYIGTPKIYGAETFVLGLHRSEENLEVAKKENSVIVLEEDFTTKYEGFDPNVSESYIIFELYQFAYLDQSIQFASLVQDQFKTRVGRKDRGVKQAGFLVLRNTAMPGVLVELGFLSNRNEERYISSAEGQTYLASAIFRSVRDYKKLFEENSHLMDKETLSNQVLPEVKDHGIRYRIQIASSKREVKEGTGVYKRFNEVFVYQESNRYKYTTEVASDYLEIQKKLVEIKQKSPDCFVVAFKNNQKIPLAEARRITNP
jgi:N-acetylmuramoyl-L-alanine amidase